MTIARLAQEITSLGDSFSIDKVPGDEKNEKWFQAIGPIINNFLKSKNPRESLFLKMLFDHSHSSWHGFKQAIIWAQENLKHWEQVLGISSRIKSSADPDSVIYSMIAEITAAKYLTLRNFDEITFNKRGIDFQCSFQKTPWNFEVTYIGGDDFKTQKIVALFTDSKLLPLYELESHRIIKKLKYKYKEEEKQLKKQLKSLDNSAIIIVTYLLETHAPWFSNVGEKDICHPFESFITSCSIPTIIIGSGSVYEPSAPFVLGNFAIDQLPF